MIGRAVDRYDFIVDRCRSTNVLHIGCADAPYHQDAITGSRWLHDLLVAVSNRCVGLDIDEAAVAWLRERRPDYNFVVGDVSKASILFGSDEFDVIVLSEVLEHLEEPGDALRALRPVVKLGGRLIVTVPNGLAARRGLKSLMGLETIHPDHVAWYSRKAISHLLARTGWTVDELRGYRLTARNGRPSTLIWDVLASMCSEFACEGIAATAIRGTTQAESTATGLKR